MGFSLQMHSLLILEMQAPISCPQQEHHAWPNEPSPLEGNCSEAMEGAARSDHNHLHGHRISMLVHGADCKKSFIIPCSMGDKEWALPLSDCRRGGG